MLNETLALFDDDDDNTENVESAGHPASIIVCAFSTLGLLIETASHL